MSRSVEVLRTQQGGPTGRPDGTFGAITVYDEHGPIYQCLSLEDDEDGNKPGSCFLAGDYVLERHTMVHGCPGLKTFMIVGTPGRSGCCFHPARDENQVEGCVGTGLSYAMRDEAEDEDTHEKNVKKYGLVKCEEAHAGLMKALEGYDHVPCTVRWAPGLPKAIAA